MTMQIKTSFGSYQLTKFTSYGSYPVFLFREHKGHPLTYCTDCANELEQLEGDRVEINEDSELGCVSCGERIESAVNDDKYAQTYSPGNWINPNYSVDFWNPEDDDKVSEKKAAKPR